MIILLFPTTSNEATIAPKTRAVTKNPTIFLEFLKKRLMKSEQPNMSVNVHKENRNQYPASICQIR